MKNKPLTIICDGDILFHFAENEIYKIYDRQNRIIIYLDRDIEFYEKQELFKCVDLEKDIFFKIDTENKLIKNIFISKRTTDNNDTKPLRYVIVICYWKEEHHGKH